MMSDASNKECPDVKKQQVFFLCGAPDKHFKPLKKSGTFDEKAQHFFSPFAHADQSRILTHLNCAHGCLAKDRFVVVIVKFFFSPPINSSRPLNEKHILPTFPICPLLLFSLLWQLKAFQRDKWCWHCNGRRPFPASRLPNLGYLRSAAGGAKTRHDVLKHGGYS